MRTALRLFTVIVLLIVAFGCRENNIDVRLDEAQQLLEEWPDSLNRKPRPEEAMRILRSITPDSIGSSGTRARYGMLMALAAYKCYETLPNDSILTYSIDYYRDNKANKKELAVSLFCRAYFLSESGLYQAAIVDADEARKICIETDNDYWHAKTCQLMSDLFSWTLDRKEAIKTANEAIESFIRAGRIIDADYQKCDLAYEFFLDAQYNEAEELLISVSNKPNIKTRLYAIRNLIPIYTTTQQYDKADSCFNILQQNNNLIHITNSTYLDKALVESKKGNFEKASGIIDYVDSLASNKSDTLGVLYTKYEFELAKGDIRLANVYLDSAFWFQNRAVDRILQQSVMSAQRDFYDRKAEKEKMEAEKLSVILWCGGAVAVVLAFAGWLAARHRIRLKNIKIKESAKEIAGIFERLDEAESEKSRLSSRVMEKDNELASVSAKYHVSLENIEALREELARVEAGVRSREENDEPAGEPAGEADGTRKVSNQEGDALLEDTLRQLDEARQKESELKALVESLFRSRNEFFNRIMSVYIDKKDSPKVKKTLVDDFEKMLEKMKRELKIENVERQVNAHMDNILVELRNRCSSLTKGDLTLIALIYAGYMPKFISEICGFSPRYFYVKRDRIIAKLEKYLAENSDRFTSRMK